jgi:hypothetical protein
MMMCVRQKRSNQPKGIRREPTNRPSSTTGGGVIVKRKSKHKKQRDQVGILTISGGRVCASIKIGATPLRTAL